MADTAVAHQESNGFADSSLQTKARLEYQKIVILRDEVFAGTHPRLGTGVKGSEVIRSQAAISKPMSDIPLSNGTATSPRVQTPSVQNNAYPKSAATAISYANVPSQKSFFASKLPTSGNGPSTLDPIFLTKSDDLVKAEMRLERQRIERSLEEQVKKQKPAPKYRSTELDTIPEFDVSEVLFQAQELVKPLAANEAHGINGAATSSSDSLDENTFYSSQINESGEEVEEPPKRRKTKPCRYFFRTGTCKYGDACSASHDPAFKKQLQGRSFSTLATNAEDTNRHPNRRVDERMEGTVMKPNYSERNNAERHREHGESFTAPKDPGRNGSIDVVGYSPPETRTPVSQRDTQQNAQRVQNQHSHEGHASPWQLHSRDPHFRRDADESPPTSHTKDVQVVRNHITSPIAPQPARVSPLAIAKQPRLAQLQQDNRFHNDVHRNSKRAESRQTSPNSAIPDINSRKRRRDPDPQEARRRVTARRYIESPDPYIKEEPMSPPPLRQVSSIQQIRHEPQRREPIIIETVSPNPGDRVIYQSRNASLNRQADIVDLRGPLTPTMPRVVSSPGQRYEFQEEPHLHRIVSTRQPQRIQSPYQDHAQYPATQQVTRSISHSYVVQPEADPARNYRGSVQPQAVRRVQRDRSLSPQLQSIQFSSGGRGATSMAPPRRIVMDQYGNKYYEATVPVERKVSVAPTPRYSNDASNSYEQPRRVSSRTHMADQYDGQGYSSQEFIQTQASPVSTSPRYVEYYPTNQATRIESRQSVYQPREEAYSDRSGVVQMIDYSEDRPTRQYEQVLRPRESIQRMQSVQPQGVQYEVIRERAPRTQSVRPEQPRIVSLGNRQEMEPAYTRQVSIRPDERYVRAPSYVASEKPRYRYVSELPDGRFAREELQDDMIVDEPRNIGGRQLQRL
ncbi:hypothetical protein MMC14_008573 [Varicellaria rhodocarpa]|nr:hypothetical protein [Varicellaria rhodocarpa]